ncbi:MAG TPA: hypothetical protein VM620_08420 [Hyphomicrobium sp.]|jgi:hypothetical protein|nr:hypothetical protein [Hyphomicrobium sp.]
MSKGTQLWPGDKMRSFFSAYIRRETSLDDVAVERLSAALTKAVNRMLVWETPEDAVPAAAAEKPAKAQAEPFNPYRFSALVVLAKQGRSGLLKRLQEIKSAENLRAFAEAQHVPVDAKVKRLDDIRKAIVAAVEQRLADRKAAAS